MNEWSFPIYRKYSNDKVFFKITAFDAFEEITVLSSGNKKVKIRAKIYPDRLRILDMLQKKMVFGWKAPKMNGIVY